MNQSDNPNSPAKTPAFQLELIPASMWQKNVRAIVAKDVWEELRWSFRATATQPTYKHLNLPRPDWRAPVACKACGKEEPELELHEVWAYDDAHRVQKLTDLIPLCELCHLSAHPGFASTIGRGAEARAHMAMMNGWSIEEAREQINQAYDRWAERSRHVYALDVSWLSQYLPDSKIHMDWLENPRHLFTNRLAVIHWARELLESDSVIVDTETTGLLEKPSVEVIELAIINFKGEILYNQRFKPRYRIPQKVIDIHGITNEAVADAPRFKEELSTIEAILAGRTVIAYHARFDSQVLARTCALFKLPTLDCRWECAMQAYRTFKSSGRYLPLPNKAHSAVTDCLATLDLIQTMARG